MTVSSITAITAEGVPRELSSFLRSGVMYVVWTDITGTGVGALRQVRWKPHTSGDFTETIPPLVHTFNSVSVLYHQPSDAIICTWDDGLGVDRVSNGNIYIAKFSFSNGSVIFGPTLLCQGSSPKISYRTSNTSDMLLYYKTVKTGGVYGRMSSDGGVTWQSGEPLITGQVLSTTNVEVLPYDDTHVSIAQIGTDPRALAENGLLKRTRPLRSVILHPTLGNQVFIGEPSKFDNTTLTDNLRGALRLSTDGLRLFHLDGVAQGTSDTFGSVARVQLTGTTPSVVASAGPVGGVSGQNFIEYSLTPTLSGLSVTLPGSTSYAVDFDVSAAYAYVAGYSNSTTSGQLVLVDLGTGATTTVFSGVTGVRAVGVANFTSPALIFVATTESGAERLRVYQENGTTPTLLLNVKLPARANNITTAPGPGAARVLVSMTNTFGVYDYYSSSAPIRMSDSFSFSGGGSFFSSVVAANGNIFVAAGKAGVLVFDPSGRTLAQLSVSGEVFPPWTPGTSYALNSLVVPRAAHPFSPFRYYFKATTGGTSGASEPQWSSAGTMTDGSVVWTPQALIDGVATSVAVDSTNKRVYAAGSAGGNLGTDGRLWVLSAGGLL